MSRQIVLDTETTGLDYTQGHRIIEIGCVEMMNRRLTGNHFHTYINPNYQVEAGALAVHGITNEFLKDKPEFEMIAHEFCAYIKDAELIIHNAPFDVGFLNHELRLTQKNLRSINDYCAIIDTLKLARKLHPGQRNSLDALCKRYYINNTHRELHGALLDAEILAHVYLAMTGGQIELSADIDKSQSEANHTIAKIKQAVANKNPLPIIPANDEELQAHEQFMQLLQESSDKNCLWLKLTDHEAKKNNESN